MKIGIIIGSLGYGGAEKVTLRLAEWFIKKGNLVSIYTTMNPPEREYKLLEDINRYMCHTERRGLNLIKKLRNTIRNDRPDIIIVMDTPMCVYAVPALIGLRIPFIVSERSNPKTESIKKITKILSHILMKIANGFIFQTNNAKKCYSKYIQKKSYVIPNPLKIEDLPRPYNGKRTKRIVAVGRIVSAKNYPLLIEAFNEFNFKYPEYILEIYGDGKERNAIEELIKKMENRKNIHLKGIHSDVLEKICSAEIYVLTSDLEGMPNALIEAMAIGIPVISTDCPSGGPADLIENMKNGILIPTKNKKVLIDTLETLVTNIELQKKLSENGLEIRKRLDIENIGNIWLEKINKIMRDSDAAKSK